MLLPTKYKLELEGQTFIGKNDGIYFVDLNKNNLSEKIVGRLVNEQPSIILYDDENNLVDHWSFSTIMNYCNNHVVKALY